VPQTGISRSSIALLQDDFVKRRTLNNVAGFSLSKQGSHDIMEFMMGAASQLPVVSNLLGVPSPSLFSGDSYHTAIILSISYQHGRAGGALMIGGAQHTA
jgi:hypothetical protein